MVDKKENPEIQKLNLKGKVYIRITDFMKLTTLSRPTIQKYVKESKIDGVVFGHKWWINQESFNVM